MQPHADRSNRITTRSAEAADCYRIGLQRLIESLPASGQMLRAAVNADSQLAVALAAIAVDAARRDAVVESRDAIERALASLQATTRRERQHVEIVALVLGGDTNRARPLAAEHLVEFPNDALIAHLMRSADGGAPAEGD